MEKLNSMVAFHCWEKDGHGIVNLRKAYKDLAMYISMKSPRKLGVDRLSETAKDLVLEKNS